MTRLWKVALGSRGEYESDALENSILTIGFGITSDLSYITDRAAMLSMLHEMFPDEETAQHQNSATQLAHFIVEMERGDLVACPLKKNRKICIARIIGDYKAAPDSGIPTRAVEWLGTDLPRCAFGKDLLASFSTPVTISAVRTDNAVARVQAVLATGVDPEASPTENPNNDTRRYFLKVNGERHCANGFCKSRKEKDWEGGEITLPTSGAVLAREGKRVSAPDIQHGDELWVWTHESKAHGGGRGLTAKATAAALRDTGDGKTVTLKDVEIIPRHLGYKTLPVNDANQIVSGSRLVDYTYSQTGYAVYLIEDEDYTDFMSLVEQRGRSLPKEQETPGAFNWRSHIDNNKEKILSELTERRLNWQKARPDQGKFRDSLFDLYGGRCLLSPCTVNEALEAAHVLPHNGDPVRDRPDNGLLLRRDLHTMFDAMLWSIDPKTNKVRLSQLLNDKSYGGLEGKVIDHHVDHDALLFHFTQFQKADKNV